MTAEIHRKCDTAQQMTASGKGRWAADGAQLHRTFLLSHERVSNPHNFTGSAFVLCGVDQQSSSLLTCQDMREGNPLTMTLVE